MLLSFINLIYYKLCNYEKNLVAIVMGSQSDWKTLIYCENILKKIGIGYEKIVSAHRTPDRLYEFKNSKNN